MNRIDRLRTCAVLVPVLLLAGSSTAAVMDINSARLSLREFNDDQNSTVTTVNNYPTLVSIDDRPVNEGPFANRHVWRFSANNGASDYAFDNDEFFQVFMDVTLTADPAAPRKEAGFLLDTVGGQGQFIVNTDAHEVVAFGGPLPFHAFPATFDSGETIRLGMTYFLDTDGKRKVIYHAGGASSPAKEFTNLEQGIIDGSRLGGYLQVGRLLDSPTNFGTATFANITIVPEPSMAGALLLTGPWLLRRKRRLDASRTQG